MAGGCDVSNIEHALGIFNQRLKARDLLESPPGFDLNQQLIDKKKVRGALGFGQDQRLGPGAGAAIMIHQMKNILVAVLA